MKTGEPIPTSQNKDRLMRMGMLAEELNKRGHNVIWFSSTFDHLKKQQLYNKDTIVNFTDNYLIYLIHAMGYK